MDKGDTKINKFYIVLAVVVIILLIITFLFSGNQINRAVVNSKYLTDGWGDVGDPTYEERFFGLEKQASIKYGLEDDDSAFLRVTTIKTLFKISEEELLEKTDETIIQSASDQNITLNHTSRIEGSRDLANGHKTFYVIYNGSINSNNIYDEVVLIGETWNCAQSGTSIICTGYAKITDSANFLGYNYSSLAKILGDAKGTFESIFNSSEFITQNGLIFNVKCH